MSDFPALLAPTIMDADPINITAAAWQRAKVNYPQLNLLPGSIEAALIEVFAAMCAEVAGSVNRVTRAVTLDLVYNFFRIPPDIGATPSVTASLTVSTAGGVEIVKGTLVEIDLGDGSPVQFSLAANVVVLPGDTTTSGTFQALAFTSKANGLASGTTLRLVSASPTLVSVVTTSIVTGGRDPEPVDAYMNRAVSHIGNLSLVNTLNRQFTDAARQQPYVSKATTIDRYDGAGGPPYTDNGHVTIVALGLDGAMLTSDEKTLLEATIADDTRVDMQIHILDPEITDVDVDAAIEVLPSYDPAQVQAAVVDALTAYLDPASWDWSATVYRFELVTRIRAVAGVARVVSLTTPATDLALTGDGPLAAAGTIDIS